MSKTERLNSTRLVSVVALSFSLGLFGACRQSEEAPKPPPQAGAPAPAAFKVVRIDLGPAVGPDKRVATPSTTFKPGDTIYASVVTEGAAPSVVLAAKWTFEDGQLVNESTQTIAPSGPAATEFHIAKPDGWPAGKYKIELAANGAAAGSREFTVVE